MGLNIFGSNCKCNSVPFTTVDKISNVTGNPNPRNFEIIKLKEIGKFTIAEIKYPDCNNYEGHKILLFYNVREETIRNYDFLDPHFCDNKKHLSPIARFDPEIGWKMAKFFAEKFMEELN
jgi:hypothetical protein